MAGKVGRTPRIPYADTSRRAFRRWEQFAGGRRGIVLMFSWAVAESTIWPVIPDFLLLPMAVARHRRPHLPLVAAMLGSALGGAAWHAWASVAPEAALRSLRMIPLVRTGHIAEVQARIARAGASALLGQPWSGIGLKVWAPVAVSSGIPAKQALPIFMATRTVRMAMVTAAATLFTRALARWIEALAVPLTVTYLVLFFRLWWRVTTRDFTQEDA